MKRTKYTYIGSVRPTLTENDKGYQFFDTTINRPIWWTGVKWVYSDGTDA